MAKYNEGQGIFPYLVRVWIRNGRPATFDYHGLTYRELDGGRAFVTMSEDESGEIDSNYGSLSYQTESEVMADVAALAQADDNGMALPAPDEDEFEIFEDEALPASQVENDRSEIALSKMSKKELVSFAEDYGVEFNPNAAKAQIIQRINEHFIQDAYETADEFFEEYNGEHAEPYSDTEDYLDGDGQPNVLDGNTE